MVNRGGFSFVIAPVGREHQRQTERHQPERQIIVEAVAALRHGYDILSVPLWGRRKRVTLPYYDNIIQHMSQYVNTYKGKISNHVQTRRNAFFVPRAECAAAVRRRFRFRADTSTRRAARNTPRRRRRWPARHAADNRPKAKAFPLSHWKGSRILSARTEYPATA